MAKLKCGTHGWQEETLVCRHIVESLKDGTPRGFCWNKSDDTWEAICEDCNNLSPDEFAASAADLVQTLCFGCFRDAAALNGIDIA